jgi:hypothetical protein
MEDVLAVLTRMWDDLGNRVGGPMTFRLVLQPAMAIGLAIRDGLKDAREGRPPYTWAVLTEPARRWVLLRQAWRAVARVFVLAIGMDVIYQYVVLHCSIPSRRRSSPSCWPWCRTCCSVAR